MFAHTLQEAIVDKKTSDPSFIYLVFIFSFKPRKLMIRVGGKVMFWSFLLHWLTPLPLFLAYDYLSIEGEGKASSTRTYAWCRPYQHVHVAVVAIGPQHLGSIHPSSPIHGNSFL